MSSRIRPQQQKKIDRDKLHRYLWKLSERKGRRMPVSNTDLAAKLGIRADHCGRIVAEMVKAGRLKKTGVQRHRVAIYEIADPDVWAGGESKAAPAEPKRLKWQ